MQQQTDYAKMYADMTGPFASESDKSAAAHSVDWAIAHDYLVRKLHREPTEAEVNRVLERM